jgi:hypothetical protein
MVRTMSIPTPAILDTANYAMLRSTTVHSATEAIAMPVFPATTQSPLLTWAILPTVASAAMSLVTVSAALLPLTASNVAIPCIT